MNTYIPGILMSFREGLEMFLIVVIILEFLDKTKSGALKKFVGVGIMAGVILSIGLALILSVISSVLVSTENVGKLWESLASLLAVSLIISFILWTIKHGRHIKQHIENKTAVHLSAGGIMVLTTVLIAREGVELITFAFAGSYQVLSIGMGLGLAAVMAILIFFSLIKVNLKIIFNITLVYLIIQAGYLAGFGVHEGLSALHGLGYVATQNPLLVNLFDVSHGILNHEEGLIGLPLNVLLGWYSIPEWIQFVVQYLTVASLFLFWFRQYKKNSRPTTA